VEVDNRAVLPCHPLNPLNGQRYSAAPFKADFTLPWEDGYVFSRPGMWFHLALRLSGNQGRHGGRGKGMRPVPEVAS